MGERKMNIKIKRAIGVILIGIAVYDLYHFFILEKNNKHSFACHIPVLNTFLCTIPTDTDLFFVIIFGIVGAYLLIGK